MTPTKLFDCVEYKRTIQERHVAETRGLKPEERTLRRQQWLKESDNPAALLWREMAQKQEVTMAR